MHEDTLVETPYITADEVADLLKERESRTFHVYYNFYEAYVLKRNSSTAETRSASSKALLHHLIAVFTRSSRTAVIAGGISITAILGLVVAYKANQLLTVQNILSEGQRRALASAEITSINDTIVSIACGDDLSKCASSGSADSQVARQTLPAVVEARIIAALNAARPYRFIDMERTSADKSTQEKGWFTTLWDFVFDDPIELSQLSSPERGNLLLLLSEANVNIDRIVSRGTLDFAALESADLSGLSMVDTNSGTSIRMRSAILRRANLDRVQWRDVTASESDIRGASFDGASLTDFLCEDCDGSDMYINGSHYTLLFRPTVMHQGGFLNSNLAGAWLNEAGGKTPIFENVKFFGISGVMNLDKSNLSGAIFRSSNELGQDGFFGDAMGALKMNEVKAEGARFDNIEINGAEIRNANFKSSIFERSKIINCVLDGTDFSNARFLDTEIKDCSLRDANFQCANLSAATFEDEDIKTAKSWQNAIYSQDQAKRLGVGTSPASCHETPQSG